MLKHFIVFAVIVVGVSYGFSDCDGSTPNTLPIYSLPPSLVSTTANGALYQSGVGVIDPPLNVLHLYGTPYQRGLAHGTLLKDDMNTLIPQVEVYMASQIEAYLTALPQWLQDLIAEAGVEAALEATFWLTEEFIPKYWLEEIQGMADGSGLDYMRLVRLHMIPELIQAQCSMIGAWGGAIANTSGSLYQLRALDWSVNGPFQQFPTYIVFHPDQGQEFAILAWAGFIGTVTGFSSAPFGLCEKVWDAYNGTRPRAGYPWHFMTRDILQFDADIDSALGRIASTQRTCSVWLGFGDYTNQFRAIGYSHDYIKVYDDKNYPSYAEHPKMEGLVYINKHVQPSHEKCLGALLQEYYGNITPEVIKTYVTALHQTGNMHIAIFDFKENFVYIANASPYVNGQYIPAYDRQFIALNMTTLFATKL